MKKVILFTMILSLLASFAYAQQGFGGQGPGFGNGPDMGCRPDCNMKGMGHFGQQGRGKGHFGPKDGMILGMAKELSLTDEQIDKIKAAVNDHQLAMVDARADVQKAQIHLKTLMRDDDASEIEVMDAIDKASMAKAKIEKMRYSHRTKIHALLNAEQQDKLKDLRHTRFESRNKWFDDDDDDDNDRPFRGRRFKN